MKQRFLANSTIFIFGFLLGIAFLYYFSNNKSSQNKLNEKEINTDYRTNNEQLNSSIKLETEIIMQGKLNSYNELRVSYIDKDMFAFLPWALIMTNKYKSKDAYIDVYYCLFDLNCTNCNETEIENWSLDKLNLVTQKFAIENLIQASKSENSQANEILEIYRKQNKYQFY